MSTSFKVEGIEELIRKVEELGEKANKEKTNAVRKGADVFKKEIKNNITTKGLVDCGVLRDSIKHSVKKGRAKIGILDLGDAYYGIFHEFGTTRLPARPFTEPALLEKAEEAQVEVANYLKGVLL